ncbi:type IV secretory system conjugative DNA transfer family protein [Frankia sp. Mgl5]|uniref:type IV secretory system conjugative DNA transfer family protein n=1 Tax=Frankia sp. Mgl5 TaxID=2933793 RepID=UPI00200F290D|nr:type IV secretory system conjugative DNA transfer family protein [Frankia sp. Mgl5]MCK9931056.1 type IV secretory system conjugative DNA transfer family protein [Frankia sp. Mgl5]
MSGTPTPRTGVLPWVVLAAGWGAGGLAWLAWMTVRLAAAAGGGQVTGFTDFLGHLLNGQPGSACPGVSRGWIAVFGVLMGAVAIAVGIGVGLAVRRWRGRARRGQTWRLALPSMAHPTDVAPLAPAGVEARARALRPSLAGVDRRALPADAAGWVVGDLLPRGPVLRGSWEDVAVAFMAPRSGKTTALAIPMTLAAPGAVVATGNKADLWAATAALCTQAGRGVWTFDPQQIAHAEQTWWWNPLAAISGIEDADRLAGHFLQEVRGDRGSGDFWMAAAGDLLASLLLAAAVADRDLTDVYAWLNDSGSPIPAEALAGAGYPAVAAGLRGRQSGAPETREGVYETARAAARCLRNDRILRWVTPGHVDRELDVATFTAGRDALYLMSKTDEGAASPLVAALTDQVVRAGVRRAEAHGGRLDPPLLLVLDEAANICKIADLPDLYSHLGSRGIVPMTILQSYRQGVRVWGEPGMDALWSAATIKIIGAGIDDPRLAEDLSKLVGEHDVPTESVSHSTQGVSVSISARRQRILDPADIRALPKGRALLLATGTRVAAIALRPWYTGPHRAQITAAITAATAHITDRAAPPAAASDPQAATSLEQM